SSTPSNSDIVGSPAVPTNVNAVSGSTTAATGSLTVTFTLGADNGSAITSQTVFCIDNLSGGPRTVTHLGSVAVPVIVTGVTTGKLYTCTVTATNARGVSMTSAPSPAVIVGSPAPPTTVKSLSGSTTT